MCYQAGELPGSLGGNTEQSEDCLTLNIFTNRWVLDSEQGDSRHYGLSMLGSMLRSRWR